MVKSIFEVSQYDNAILVTEGFSVFVVINYGDAYGRY